jgi:hypothetical protein
MLRFKLGTDVFLKALRAYQKDDKLIYGFAKTDDLKRHLEEASGYKLDSFFRQWFEGQGYPSYQVKWSQIGTKSVKIKMNQTTSDTSVKFFELPVALKFKNATNEKTVVVDNKYNGEVFYHDIGFIADSVFVDPEYWLITKNNTVTKVNDLEPLSGNMIVFPNPFTNDFNILLQNYTGNEVSINLFAVNGQKVFSQTYQLYNGKEFINIPSTSLGSGKYILSVIDTAGNKTTTSLLKL